LSGLHLALGENIVQPAAASPRYEPSPLSDDCFR